MKHVSFFKSKQIYYFARYLSTEIGLYRYLSTETGLYGIPILSTAKGFERFVDEAIAKSRELVAYVSQLPPSDEVIETMDEISNTVCSVIDAAELCRQTHPDREYVEEATKASMRIYDHLHYLNTNHNLYNAVVKAERGGILKTEAHRAAIALRTDFEKGGIHLSTEKMDRVNQLHTEIVQLGREFNENILIDPGSIDVYPASRIPKQLQHQLEPIYRPYDTLLKSSAKKKEKGYRITTDSSTLSLLLRWTADAEVRKQAFIMGKSAPCANLDVLDRLISARSELAQLLGCKSYAEFAVRPNMAASPDVVMSFLGDLSSIVKLKADEEFKTIRDFKRKMCNEKCADLEPWDEQYFTGMMKSSACDLDSTIISSYFSLSNCLEGLNVLVESLFGVMFHNMHMKQGEYWHPDVMKLALHHPEEGDLGYLYLDLYSREGKYPGCAHFAIQGGRKLSETKYQLPIAALVCNFSALPGTSSRLNHWEVETLFHEFGHALHSLLSRTDYQHFSGTRVVLDLAETPSNLFEHFAWDYRVLRTFAKHYSTGEVIPEKMVNSMNSARNMFAATELQRQIYLSIVDLTLFGEQSTYNIDTTSIVGDLKTKYTSWRHVEGTSWHTRFTHLMNYGAGSIPDLKFDGYYSYLYAKCFAATIWDDICSEDPLSRNAGMTIRTKLLQHGGAKDPVQLLRDCVGSNIVQNYNGGIIPDIKSVCKGIGLPLI